MSFASRLIALPIHFYRLVLSPLKGPSCRYLPSCSHYALEALARHGARRGLWLAIRRISRCHPWGGFGYDPVPDKTGGRGDHRYIPSGSTRPNSSRPNSTRQAPASRASSSAT